MFKVLVLQASYSLADERTEFLIKDRLSFMRFLGLGLADPVPDANTIWTFREGLTRATPGGKPAIKVLFERFDAALRQAGFLAMGGQIIDASIVACPSRSHGRVDCGLLPGRVRLLSYSLWRRPWKLYLTVRKHPPPSVPSLAQCSSRWN
jgi:transposase, IS5 family